MKALLIPVTAVLVSCEQAAPAVSDLDALEACVADAIVVSNARVEASGSSDFVYASLTNGLDWAIAGVFVEYTVFDTSSTTPPSTSAVRIALSDHLLPGDTVDLTLGLFIADTPTMPPYRAQVRVRDVNDTAGLPLVGRKPDQAPAPARVSQQTCEVA